MNQKSINPYTILNVMMGLMMITVGLLEDNKLMAKHLGTILDNWSFVSEVFYFKTNEEFEIASH